MTTRDPQTMERLRRICDLVSAPDAPYAHTIEAKPGMLYDSDGPPYPPLTVLESVTTPIKELLYHRQTVAVEIHPGEEPEKICINRMVGILEDGREVPMGETWALPDEMVRAAERGSEKCSACGILIREQPEYDAAGLAYHKGCLG